MNGKIILFHTDSLNMYGVHVFQYYTLCIGAQNGYMEVFCS